MDKELTIVASSVLTLLLLKKELLSMFVKLEWENIEQSPGAKSSGAGFSLGSLIAQQFQVAHLNKKTLEDKMKKRKKVKN